ncbi:MAG: acyltransferase family protein [Clostridia bacterium]|nr:acyltransferase family protein [Clostridia bacterium]
MSDVKLSEFYEDTKNDYHSRTDLLKFLLMPFAFFVILGFPGKFGSYVATYSNFVAQVFFILYGFFTLVPDKEKRRRKLKRSLKRALKLFAIMFVSYVIINVIYLSSLDSLDYLISSDFWRKRNIFNFLVLNVWPLPIGNAIWFVQSLVYAFLFFFIAQKLKLEKFYAPLLIILILFMLCTGEFAAYFGFPHFGYYNIPGGAVTRAIPYMLIGMYLRKYVDLLSKIPRFVYLLFFPAGLFAAVVELETLNRIGMLLYLGHTVGFGIMALSLCCFSLAKPKRISGFLSLHGNNYSRRMYAFCQPVSFTLWLLTYLTRPEFLEPVKEFRSIIAFAICLVIATVIGLVKYNKKA